jgi:Tfp pilus assembly protein FimT
MMVVVAIAGIAMAFAIPAMGTFMKRVTARGTGQSGNARRFV